VQGSGSGAAANQSRFSRLYGSGEQLAKIDDEDSYFENDHKGIANVHDHDSSSAVPLPPVMDDDVPVTRDAAFSVSGFSPPPPPPPPSSSSPSLAPAAPPLDGYGGPLVHDEPHGHRSGAGIPDAPPLDVPIPHDYDNGSGIPNAPPLDDNATSMVSHVVPPRPPRTALTAALTARAGPPRAPYSSSAPLPPPPVPPTAPAPLSSPTSSSSSTNGVELSNVRVEPGGVTTEPSKMPLMEISILDIGVVFGMTMFTVASSICIYVPLFGDRRTLSI
jgi:hypothetical protein